MITQQELDTAHLNNGYSYCKLDLAKVLLALQQEEEWDAETLNEISDRMEIIYQIREVSGFSLPIEIKD